MNLTDSRKNAMKHGKLTSIFMFFLFSCGNAAFANADFPSPSSSNLLSTAESELQYDVLVIDLQGKPVKNVVVEFHSTSPILPSTEKSATMDQVEQQFTPHILAIEKGTVVNFPNSDNIKHHIYSFSKAKSFEQGLYQGMQATPILFDKHGIVDLGCNIHDWMLGYIYVANSRYFAKTNELGKVVLSIPISIDSVSIWHPRMQEKTKRVVTMTKDSQTQFSFQLQNAMLEDTEGYEDLSLDAY